MKTINISEASQSSGLSIDTLRYYEKMGAIPNIKRNAHGQRDYTELDLQWIYVAKCMRQAGLSMNSLVEYVKLSQEGDTTINRRVKILKSQLDELIIKQNEIQETIELLTHKINHYDQVLQPKTKE